MIDVIIAFSIVLLIFVSIWLYLATEQVEAILYVNPFLPSDKIISSRRKSLPTKSETFLGKIKAGLINLASTFLIVGKALIQPVLIVIAIYFAVIVSNNAIKIILFIASGLASLSLFTRWYRQLLILFKEIFFSTQIPPRKMSSENYSGKPEDFADDSLIAVRYTGWAQIPLKVYEGDSYNITITLHESTRRALGKKSSIKIQKAKDTSNMSLTVNALQHNNEQEFLELEILAAGFTVEGDKKQTQKLSAESLRYQWNCFFENSGNHIFVIAFRITSKDSIVSEIGQIEQNMKVVKIDHLTQRQVWVLATIAGILSGSLAILEIIKNLGFW